MKPIHAFRVRVVRHGKRPSCVFEICGVTFFAARADFCADMANARATVHPDEVRPVPTGDGCRVQS